MKTSLRPSDTLWVLLPALLVGLGTGLFVLFFRRSIEFVHHYWYDTFSAGWVASTLTQLNLDPRWHAAISLGLAGLLIGLLTRFFLTPDKYHGVSNLIVATAVGGGKLRFREMPIKAVASAFSLGAGASLGPEDPSVQIGANWGSFVGTFLRLPEVNVRLMVAAGTASAVAAAFNAPIAGVFFAIEVILVGELAVTSSAVVMLASVMSAAVAHALRGTNPILGNLTYELGSPLELPLFMILGIILGGVCWVTIRWYDRISQILHRVPLPVPLLTCLVGVVVGGIGRWMPEILGVGEHLMHAVVNGEVNYSMAFLVILAIVKLLTVGLSKGGGFVGGIFAPTLFVGIMLGNAYGQAIDYALPPSIETHPNLYAIAGMAGLLAGVVQAPITAILLVFELTNDYLLILPIMMTSIVCVFTLRLLKMVGFYHLPLVRDGLNITADHDIDVMQGIRVKDAMASPPFTIVRTAKLSTLRESFRDQRVHALCVLREDGMLYGVVTLGDLQRYFDQVQTLPNADHVLKTSIVGDICSRNPHTVYSDEELGQAIRLMAQHQVGRLPVLDRFNNRLVGVITRHMLVNTYNDALSRKLEEQHTADRVRLTNLTGAQVMEFHIDKHSPIAWKHIADVDWHPESVVASIQRNGKLLVPRGSSMLRVGDTLTIIADPRSHEALERLFVSTPPTPSIDDGFGSDGQV